MDCPKCGGNTYDNRAENDARLAKGEKMRPDYKCKDKNCDGCVWRPKEGWGAKAATPAKPATASKEAHSSGPLIEGLDDTGDGLLPHEKLDRQFAVYDLCFSHAMALYKAKIGQAVDDGAPAIASIAATLFIQAAKAGV